MKSISIGQLRQNPTEAFDDVERGETLIVTRYRKQIGRIVPEPQAHPSPTGEQVLDAMRRTPLTTDDTWSQQLAEDRAADAADDPWAA